MKPLIYVIVTLYMFNYVFSDETIYCTEIISPQKISDCTDHEMSEEEIKRYKNYFEGADSCCYMTITNSGKKTNQCTPFKKSYVNKYYVNILKEDFEADDLSIDCGSGTVSASDSDSDSIWLSLSLTFLLFGLLF